MITIWKYPVNPGVNNLMMPLGAEVLDVQVQYGQPVLWALVDTVKLDEQRKFAVYGTGHPIPNQNRVYDGLYIGTFQLGGLVFHLFEEAKQ